MPMIDRSQISATSFGHFSPDGKEYVITNLGTPRPWTNVMSNGRYGLVVSHLGGSFSWLDNCQLQRVTRWEQDLSEDIHGRFVYVQDRNSKQTWTTTYQPTQVVADEEQVVHGMGYTRFDRSVHGIATRQTVFVPRDLNAEVWLIEIENLRDERADLTLCSAVDWHLGGQGNWHREFHRLFLETQISGNTQFAWCHTGLRENSRQIDELPFIGYQSLIGADVQAWIGDRAAFFGSPPRSAEPLGLDLDYRPASTGRWDDAFSGARTTISLAPGEKRVIAFVLGTAGSVDHGKDILAGLNLQTLHDKLQGVIDHYAEMTSATAIKTSDAQLDALMNNWLKYQTITCRIDARCAYYQQGGAYGYRDQLQDSLLCLHHDPSATLRQLILHAEAMYEDGGVRHWWHPGTSIFVESHHSDTCLWLAFGTLAYLDETNDSSALDIPCRFLNRRTQTHQVEGTLLDHCMRGIQRALSKRSERGLPLIQAGDWNDGLSHAGLDGKGESVWLAMFLFDILQRFSPILKEVGMPMEAENFLTEARSLAEAVEAHGWDGQWYIAGTQDQGTNFGSSKCQEGRIFLNPQTWSVITGIGSPDRQGQAMESAERELFKPYGALLLAPAYSKVDPNVGYITRYAPGLRENGGVYSHASTWAVIALAKQGRHERALQVLRSMLPCKEDARAYAAEPYVMPGNIDGPDSPYEGKAGWTWYTGSSAWMVRVMIDYVMGVRATREGLVIDPEAGKSLGEFELKRRFRGDDYIIKVSGTGPNVTVDCLGQPVVRPITGPGNGSTILINVTRS